VIGLVAFMIVGMKEMAGERRPLGVTVGPSR
jgi:hypothetical protein